MSQFRDHSTEVPIIEAMKPMWVRELGGLLTLVNWVIKFCAGSYFQRQPIFYSLYTSDDDAERKVFLVQGASFRWRTA